MKDLLSNMSMSASSMSPSPTTGRAGHPLDEQDPLKHITADLRSEKLILHLIQFRVLV